MAEIGIHDRSKLPLPRFTYHVFLSFRGEDTRKNFTDHLYTALTNAGIRTFRDDDEIERGENIEKELQRGIRESRVFLVVFSRNYATSRWCLDELLRIVECRKRDAGRVLLPVFYSVEPIDVKDQTGSFGEAFVGHEVKLRGMEEGQREDWIGKMKKWRAALTEIAQLEGMVLSKQENGHEAKFIQKIVQEIVHKLKRVVLSVPTFTVGIENRVEKMNRWLESESDDVGIAVINGMAGVGKTTIAKVAYNLNYERFEASCFLAKIRQTSEQNDGLVRLQRQLLEGVLQGRNEKFHNVDEGITKIKESIGCKRTLLVLDDVDQVIHLQMLIGSRDWFHPGSKIIITTRRAKLLTAKEKHEVYKIEELDSDESLKLFSWHAFGKEQPVDGFFEYSREALRHCGGIPFALQELGRSLSGRDADLWISALKKLETTPNGEIQKRMKISYDSLPDYHDKNLFLHIANSFVGEDKDYAVRVLENNDFHATVGLQNLIDRSLVSIDSENKLVTHQLFQEMGREILRKKLQNDPDGVIKLAFDKEAFHHTQTLMGSQMAAGEKSDLIESVNSKKIKRSRSQGFYDEPVLQYVSNSLKRWLLGFLH